MKILTIVYTLNRGGTERAAQNFSIAYKESGHEVAVLPIYEKGVREEPLTKKEIVVFEPFKNKDFSIEAIKDFSPEIIHIHRAGIKDSVINELLNLIKSVLPKIKIAETNVFSQVDHGLGENLIDLHMHLSKWCFWKWKINIPYFKKTSISTVLPYMVIPDSFHKIGDNKTINQFKRDNNIPEDKFIFGRVAQKSEAKWSLDDIKSFLLFSKDYSNCHLVLLGVSAKAKIFVDSLDSDEKSKITVLDYIDGDSKLNELYNSMDVFIHAANIGESFGMVFAESMLAETPVITFATPLNDNSQHEVIPEGTGFVVRDKSNMISKMKFFYENKSELDIFGKRARKHILNNFSPSVLTHKAISLFNLLLNEDRDNLKVKLKENSFTTDVSKSEILKLYSSSKGKISLKEKIFFLIPKLYTNLREIYGSLRG